MLQLKLYDSLIDKYSWLMEVFPYTWIIQTEYELLESIGLFKNQCKTLMIIFSAKIPKDIEAFAEHAILRKWKLFFTKYYLNQVKIAVKASTKSLNRGQKFM